MNSNFWSDKKVLITGHTGFKGSWLAYMLSHLGTKLIGLSDYEYPGIYTETNAKVLFEKEYFIDIRNISDEILKEIDRENFDIIFHFAAQSLVHEASENPIKTLETNIMGTYNILELFNNANSIKTISISTTDKVYKNPSSKNSENFEIGGHEFYSSSKVGKENVINAYLNTRLHSGKNISTIRSGNVIGGGDRGKNRLVPDIINSLKSKSNIYLRNPNSIRPWQHVLDSLSGYLLAVEHSYNKNISEIFNLNSELNNKYTVENITQNIVKAWNSQIKIENLNSDFFEVDTLKINSEKAKKILSWKSKYHVDDIVKLIVEWEKASDKTAITKKQVDSFFKDYL